jgi:hypothetical protein
MDKESFRRGLTEAAEAVTPDPRAWERLVARRTGRVGREWTGPLALASVVAIAAVVTFAIGFNRSRITTLSAEGADPSPAAPDRPVTDVIPPADPAEGSISDCTSEDLSAVLTLDKAVYQYGEKITMTLTTINISSRSCRVHYQHASADPEVEVGEGRLLPNHDFVRLGSNGLGGPGFQHMSNCDPEQLDFAEGEEVWESGHQDVKNVVWDVARCPISPGTGSFRGVFLRQPGWSSLVQTEWVQAVIKEPPSEPSPAPSPEPSPNSSPSPTPSESPSPEPSPTES